MAQRLPLARASPCALGIQEGPVPCGPCIGLGRVAASIFGKPSAGSLLSAHVACEPGFCALLGTGARQKCGESSSQIRNRSCGRAKQW